MKFIPNSDLKKEMLDEIGLKNVDELFSDIPKKIRVDELNLPEGLSQRETEKKLRKIGSKNKDFNHLLSFLGGGIKPHYVPAVVKSIISRSEFYSAYTPYQSEASQGFLQAIFEYQSMIADLTGMDVANASLYDGPTSLGEAALMCSRVKRKKKKFVVPENISREKKSILKNYVRGADLEIEYIDFDEKSGRIDVSKLEEIVDEKTAGVYVENPNFFGVFENQVEEIEKIVHNANSLFVVGVDPFSLGIVKNPGEYNADIVIAEGSGLGIPIDFGGSSLGVFACKKKFLRKMPGRIIGLTEDEDGKQSFCMSLQTREQHIRRGRATSNICTNQGLCALACCVYLSWLGGEGLQEIGETNFENGQKLMSILRDIDGFNRRFNGVHFNEMVIKYDGDVETLNDRLLNHDIQGGLPVDSLPGLDNCMLFGVTEVYGDDDFERLNKVLQEEA
ncbi:MAG: aminomethyl-transferring glycine dehydrogenase subunit GcvPA [Candidatus Thermoplasmatota archaeon]